MLRGIRISFLTAMVVSMAGCEPAATEAGPAVAIDNTEMQDIVDVDQADREPTLQEIDWSVVGPRDAARRERVRVLLDAGELRTANDFASAALVFQHGATSDDILLAHVLAMTAVAEGHGASRRLAAITLDRYLGHIGQPQIFGTQFSNKDISDARGWTLEPYDINLVPDALRAINCVESRAAAQQQVERLRRGDMTDPAAVCPDGKPR
jgi:hypothetical protein